MASSPLQEFNRGDANNDGRLDIADPIWTINALFMAGPPSVCQDAADSNDDGSIDISDAQYSISYLFEGGPAPSAPFGACGLDPSDDAAGEDGADGLTCDADGDGC